MNRDLKDYLCGLTLIEDAYNPYEPEYLKMDEEREAERVCMRCEEKYYRKSCEDYCDRVIECLEERQKLLSSANRVIDALVKRGYGGLSMYLKDGAELQGNGQIEFEWGTSEA